MFTYIFLNKYCINILNQVAHIQEQNICACGQIVDKYCINILVDRILADNRKRKPGSGHEGLEFKQKINNTILKINKLGFFFLEL